MRVVHHRTRERQRVGAAEDRVAAVRPGERTDVQVVDHLDHQIVEVVDQLDVFGRVAGDAEPGEHVMSRTGGS